MTFRSPLRDLTGVEVPLAFAFVVLSALVLVWWVLSAIKAYRAHGMRSAILRPGSLVVLLLGGAWLFAFTERNAGILPEGDLRHLEDYHCWPYNVSVYAVDEVRIDPTFRRYPLDSYFPASKEWGITRWTNYAEVDTATWNGADHTLKNCEGNNALYRSLEAGRPLYFAGMFRTMIVSNGSRKRVYERLLFLDVTGHRLHVFKDINKVL